MSNRSNDHDRSLLIYVIENPMFTNSQLPNRFYVFPRWRQAKEHLSISGLSCWLVPYLFFDAVQDTCSLICAHFG